MREGKDKVERLSRKIRYARLFTSSIYLIYLLNLLPLPTAHAATFTEQRTAISRTIATQPESAILSLLAAGLEEGKPTQAIAETQKWLQKNVPEDPTLLYHAARAAELSADWKTAISLYRQYLLRADLTSKMADDAVHAVYTLYFDRVIEKGRTGDVWGAYEFSRAEGDRLLVCPRARQFDEWFLHHVTRYNQRGQGVINRLMACLEAGLPADLLSARYETYFVWLLTKLDTPVAYNDHNGMQLTDQMASDIEKIIAAMNFDEELKLRLDWALSVKRYNKAQLEGNPPQAPSASDGKQEGGSQAGGQGRSAAPIAQATALLAKHPHYAKWVQDGWMHRDAGEHWQQEIDAKLAPVLAALPKLTPLQQTELMQGWRADTLLTVKTVRAYVKAHPELMNSQTGVVPLDKPWNELTPEEAMTLAPQLVRNPSKTAALIRAKAAGGKEQDYGKMAAAYLGAESWRLPMHHDQRNASWFRSLRDLGSGTEEQNSKVSQLIGSLGGGLNTVDVKKDAPAAERLAVFRKFWADYTAPQPKITSVHERLRKILAVTPEAIPELLKDPRAEAQLLAREAVSKRGIKIDGYSLWIAGLWRLYPGNQRNFEGLKAREPEKAKPHELEPALRGAVAHGIKQGKMDAWQLIAWVNLQYPEDNTEQLELVQQLVSSPIWKTLPHEVRQVVRGHFKGSAVEPAHRAVHDAINPTLVCKDLLSITNVSDVAATSVALQKALDGVRQAPTRIDIQGLDNLALVSEEVFTDPKVLEMLFDVTDELRGKGMGYPIGKRLRDWLIETPDPVLLHRAAISLWQSAVGIPGRRYRNHPVRAHEFSSVSKLTHALLDDEASAAKVLARAGLTVFGRQSSYPHFDHGRDLPPLKALIGKASLQMGLVSIPVGRNDPAYPIYKSQAEWMSGNEETAWTMVEDSWEALLPVHRDLSTEYLLWVLQRTIYSREDARMEELIKALMAWIAEPGSPWSTDQKIDIEIAYGDIALQMGQLENAHKLYVRIQKNPAYSNSVARHAATLRRVKAERIGKRYDAALRTLQELDMERIPEMWAPSRYARAEVYYDMEEFDDASDDVNALLARDPNHAEAKIMQGKLQLARQKLMEASELDLGSPDAQTTLVPGEKLKVTLDDPTLAVSGMGTEIEVVVWATSGDRERFLLRQFGDKKTKFRGEVASALGAPAPDDRTLQLIGDDEIYFAYSERFRKKMNNMAEKRGGPITVKSDAILMASARKLLSEAEQRIADQKRLNEALAKRHMSKLEASKMGGDQLADLKAEIAAAERARQAKERIKPGRDINVRVIDPDRSRTAAVDELKVSVATSSGDSIASIALKETGPFTGTFEGMIPTVGAPAMAFAAHTEPGRNPNSVISPATGAPAWKPVKGENPIFTIDLNDNVELGEMTVSAREPGAKLHQFFVETGINAHEVETVVGFPLNPASVEKPWHPSVRIMNALGLQVTNSVAYLYDVGRRNAYFRQGWKTDKDMQGVARNVTGPSAALAASIAKQEDWKHNSYHWPGLVIYRFRGYFYEKSEVTRRFRLELGEHKIPTTMRDAAKFQHPAPFMLAVDGRPITNSEDPAQLEGQATLKQGLHRFEIWATGWSSSIGFGRTVKLLANVDGSEELSACPDSFFDPARIPPGTITEQRNGRAAVMANADGTEFKVTFAPGSRTRLLRLRVRSHEGAVPALNSIRLTDAKGKQVLPVATDYAALNRNATLEILTGDKVTVRYLDDRFVTEDKQKHERFLNVGFSNARIGFERYFQRWSKYGPLDTYDRVLRFLVNDPFPLTIRDADMDSTDGRDTLKVTLASKSGGERSFEALESEEYPGTFVLSVTAVAGTPAESKPGQAAPQASQAGGRAQIKVGEGEMLTAIYRDTENIRPGVSTERHARVGRAVYRTPKLFASHATVAPLDYSRFDYSENAPRHRRPPQPAPVPASYGGDRGEATAAGLGGADLPARSGTGTALPRWAVKHSVVALSDPPEGGIGALHGMMLSFAVDVPHLALRGSSTVDMFVQSDAGREQGSLLGDLGGDTAETTAFNITVPGTLRLSAGLGGGSSWLRPAQNPIYWNEPSGRDVPYEQGATFNASVPLIPGVLPEYGVLSSNEIQRLDELGMWVEPRGLVAQSGEKVHVGFRYTDESGAEQWLTGAATVGTHAILDVMEDGYQEAKTNAFVGESLYVRVVDLGGDVSDESDTVSVLMQAKSGAKHKVALLEVGEHSGVFQSRVELSYARKDDPGLALGESGLQGAAAADAMYDVRRDGFPVSYSDVMGVRYTDALGWKSATRMVRICKGADGGIAPFSKTYSDPDIGMDTQFLLAESYLEMAARHRKLGETERAAEEYARAKDMLEKAMEMFRDPETRAHAEFLLATLTQEEADTTEDGELKLERYRAALSRYMRVTRGYTESIYASQAQYKIATVYEKMDEPEIAAQEYVKLAYKYPDSEFLALSMVRLGGHFKRKAGEYEARGKALLAKSDDKEAQVEAEAMRKMAMKEYVKSAGIYGRMQERFPDHELAGKSGLQAGKVFMRAGDMHEAVAAFKRVIDNESYDGPTIRAQAMYWAGKAMEAIVAATERPSPDDAMAAYSYYKRLTYDFPESKWAAYARGQLEQEQFLSIEDALEAGGAR
ncbi:MAG: tetratricopeptide repeat protein [Verrucomicrobia bacterium]|jgi:tetratricopeptide (TPR) repeat protein|nr:tetratricopeptide repeat protein [Verrucomicrobiota bacterium]